MSTEAFYKLEDERDNLKEIIEKLRKLDRYNLFLSENSREVSNLSMRIVPEGNWIDAEDMLAIIDK